jgi:O-antigen/teichoic acid export membrane protein
MLFYLFDNYAKGLYDTIYGNFYKEFFQRFLIFLAACLVAFKLVDFDSFIGFWTVAICLPTLFMAYRAYQLGNFSIAPNFFFFSAPFKREFLQFSVFSVATGFSSIIITHLDKLMVNGYLGLGSAGIYGFSLLFGNAMTISYNIAAKAATAIVLDAMEVKEYSKIESIYKKSGITQLVLGCFMLLIVWVNIDELLSFIKPEFAAAKWPIIIIGLGKLFELANGINTLILAYSKHYKLDSLLIATFIGVLYILNQLLIPAYAINGAAIAAVASIVYYNSFRTYLIQRFFKINPFSFGQLKVLALGTVILLIGLQLPTIGTTFIERAASIAYRSVIVGGGFVVGIYFLRVSADIDSVFAKMLSFVKSGKKQD